jgi:hypothetical protein
MKTAGEVEWNRSRIIAVVYLMVLGALLAGYYFYQHAIRYNQSYDMNCAAPGVLTSDIWGWEFMLQGFTGLLFIPFLMAGFTMLLFWSNRIAYYIVVIFSLLLVGYQFAISVHLTIEASRANTCTAVGNSFNDFRICGVCGTFIAWTGACFNTAPYNPPVTGNLMINAPKSFQLAFNWIFFLAALLALGYVPTYYIKSQDTFLAALKQKTFSESGTPEDPDEESGYAMRHTKQAAVRQQQQQVRSKYSVLK